MTLLAPALWHRWDSARSLARQRAYSAFGAEFLDALQGLGTLKAFGQSGARATLLAARSRELFPATMGVLGTNTLARGITDVGIALGAAVALGWGVHRVRSGVMPLETLLVILMLGVEVFRPLRDLRVLLHQGMLGLSAARGVLALLSIRADGPRRVRRRHRRLPSGPDGRLRRRDLRLSGRPPAGARAPVLHRAGR